MNIAYYVSSLLLIIVGGTALFAWAQGYIGDAAAAVSVSLVTIVLAISALVRRRR